MTRALVVVLLALGLAAPASAAPPELFVRESPWDTHEPVSDWLPLAAAPVSSYVGGYEIGYRRQAAGFQRVALTVAGVPDGVPSQPRNATPFCVADNGPAGEIVGAGPELQFEGNGRYTVSVSVIAGDRMDCLTAGETSTGAFDVAARPAPAVTGEPIVHRAKPVAGFAGVTVPDQPGGASAVQCALGAAVLPGPDKAAREIPEQDFPRPGDWACQARAYAEGLDESFSGMTFTGDWSAPLSVLVRADFARSTAQVVGSRSAKRVGLSVKAEFVPEAAGGAAVLTVTRVTGCRGRNYRTRRIATVRGRFSSGGAVLKVKRPKRGFYLGRLAFGGTRLVRAGEDPRPLLLTATRKRFGFATSAGFPRC